MTPIPLAFDHVGIRVVDKARSLAFYASLGFEVDPDYSNDRVAEIVAPSGLRLNLIFNGEERSGRSNVLMDIANKWPGITHAAFTVESMDELLAWANKNAVSITEGPVDWGRRTTCFLRDPDGNVLEFNELK
jgi:catechol 2,3-dioxygenase-like lactoylglutathione lyase family enzyme